MRKERHNSHRWIFEGFARITILTGFTIIIAAQSRDIKHPTSLTSRQVSGTLGGANGTEHFYSFNACPGDVKVTLTFEAGNDLAASAITVEFDETRRKDGETVTTRTGTKSVMAFRGRRSEESQTVPVRFAASIITVRVSLLENAGSGKYKLTFDGPIRFEESGPSGIGNVVEQAPCEETNAPNEKATGDRSAKGAERLAKRAQEFRELAGTWWVWKGKVIYQFPSDKPGIVIALAGNLETLNIRSEVIPIGTVFQVGTYTQEGDTVRMDFPEYAGLLASSVIATLKGDTMEGELTYADSRRRREQWKTQKTSRPQ